MFANISMMQLNLCEQMPVMIVEANQMYLNYSGFFVDFWRRLMCSAGHEGFRFCGERGDVETKDTADLASKELQTVD